MTEKITNKKPKSKVTRNNVNRKTKKVSEKNDVKLKGKNQKPKIKKKVVTKKEEVIHPNRYTDNFSGIEVIESNCDLTNCLSNIFKYCMRAGKKDAILQEFQKALFYCNFYIEGVDNGKITPQNRISTETYVNIRITANKAIEQFENNPNNIEYSILAELYSNFFMAIYWTQKIRWWKFNRKTNTLLHIKNLENVKSSIESLINYYKGNKLQ